ncbi:hypothetical protein GQ53DRAFT_599373, partial [Thozetella sp. PMI_491]
LRARAPVAANLEDCIQAFAKLCSALDANRSAAADAYITADNCRSRLISWGHESGASSNSLDQALRWSVELRHATLDLLRDLDRILSSSNAEIGGEDASGTVHTPDPGLDEDLEEADDIVDNLYQLLPSHLDPSADDGNVPVTELTAALDIQAAASMFPKAPTYLTERLGKANFRRRRHIRLVRLRDRSRSNSRSPTRRGQPAPERLLPSIKPAASIAEWKSETGSTAPSSIFSRIIRAPTEITTQDSVNELEALELTPPPPPQTLHSGQPFPCPFCGLVIIPELQLTDVDKWNRHVHQDLKPYLCTFDSCLDSHKTYSMAEDWFQHELECHRISEVWVCSHPRCRDEFNTAGDLEAHTRGSHGDMSAMPAMQFGLLADTQKRWSETQVPDLHCTLCGCVGLHMQTLKQHLAYHLEQFALLATIDRKVAETNSEAHESLATNGMSATRGEESGNETRQISRVPWTARVKAFLLKQEPEESKTEPATPTIWSNTPPPNLAFVGREDELAEIKEFLSSTGRICVLTGDGGIGKTSAAVQYSYMTHKYDYIFWVDAEKVGRRTESYNLIATTLDLGGVTQRIRDSEGVTVLVRESLTCLGKRWLLVLDNVEQWRDISRHLPSDLGSTQGCVLITTRCPALTTQPLTNYKQIDMRPLTEDEGTQMLLQATQPSLSPKEISSHPEYDMAREAARVVDKLPLAISMIAGFLNGSSCSVADFLDLWKEGAEIGTSDPIDAMWEICLQELPMLPRQLLDVMTFFDPDAIPKDILCNEHKEKELSFLSSMQPVRFQRMVDALSGRRLIAMKENSGQQEFNMHRLLQWKIQAGLPASAYKKAFHKAFMLIRKKYPQPSQKQVLETSKWEACRKYTPQVASLRRTLQRTSLIGPSLEFAQLFYDAGFGVWSCQMAAVDGIAYLKASERILDSLHVDRYHRLRSDIHSVFGDLCETIGASMRQECLLRRREALETRKKIYEDDPSDVNEVLWVKAANDYGVGLMDVNNFEEAGTVFENCHASYSRWGSEEDLPHEYAKSYHNRAMVMMWQGEHADAIASLRRAIHLAEVFSGKEWLYWQYQFDLGCLLLQSGDKQAALELHITTLSARQELYGKHAQSTTLSWYAVACVNLYREYNWPEEALARARFQLGQLHTEQGQQLDAARSLMQQARDTLEKYQISPLGADDE